MNITAQDPCTPATRIRYVVVAMAVLLAMVTYLDRACIGTLRPTSWATCRLRKAR